jgi:membrane protease YdiL (CAAX protease family)
MNQSLSDRTEDNGIGHNRRAQGLELAVFLFLILPSMAMSFFLTERGSVGFGFAALSTILRDLALVSLVLFFLWHNREPVARIGWVTRHVWPDVILGIVLFVPVTFGSAALDGALQSVGFSSPATPSFLEVQNTPQTALAVVLVIVVAVAEETIFRGYLILRFGRLTGSIAAAVVLSSLVFSFGHGYEGTAGVVTVGVMGAAFALVYVWRRSLVAPVVMHFLQDFMSIVLLPLLAQK